MNGEGNECYRETKERESTLGNEGKIGYEWDQETQWKEDRGAFLEVRGVFRDTDIKSPLGSSSLWISKYTFIVWIVVDVPEFRGSRRFWGYLVQPIYLSLFVYLFIYIDVELIYNISLVSGGQQSDSFIHTYISSFSRFFSLLGYYQIWCRVPCAIQQDLVGYVFYI